MNATSAAREIARGEGGIYLPRRLAWTAATAILTAATAAAWTAAEFHFENRRQDEALAVAQRALEGTRADLKDLQGRVEAQARQREDLAKESAVMQAEIRNLATLMREVRDLVAERRARP